MRLFPWTISRRRAGIVTALAGLAAVACSSAAGSLPPPSAVQSPVPSPSPAPVVSPTRRPPLLTPTPAPPKPTATPLGILDDKYTAAFEKLTPSGTRNVDPDKYRAATDVDDILPIYDPLVVPASDVELLPDELVIGVEINGEARAYPHRLMQFREVANDVVGGVPILVTW